MDPQRAAVLIEQLGHNVTGLKESLQPLVGNNLHETASKLPVLDRAKLYIFVAYTIESILFSNLRLQGIDAKQHPVFTELTRVRQYFEKIKLAEQGEQKPTMQLDKAAAERFVKHGLAGNKAKGTKRTFTDDSGGRQAASLAVPQANAGGGTIISEASATGQKASDLQKKSTQGEKKRRKKDERRQV